jgi:hypothetical protein
MGRNMPLLTRLNHFGWNRAYARGIRIQRMSLIIAFTFTTQICWAQVRITSLSRLGELTWTNSVTTRFRAPIYSVEWTSSPTGKTWHVLAVVTNKTSIVVTNSQSWSSAATFYRVVWINGSVWRYSGYNSQSLITSGKVYVSTSFDTGRWYLTNAGPSIPFFPDGSGPLQPCFVEALCLQCGVESCFWVDGPWSEPVSFGYWHWEGGILPSMATGPFIVERIVNGN